VLPGQPVPRIDDDVPDDPRLEIEEKVLHVADVTVPSHEAVAGDRPRAVKIRAAHFPRRQLLLLAGGTGSGPGTPMGHTSGVVQ